MKKLVRQSKILGAMALTAFAFMFIACGGDARSKAESYIKEKYPDAKILSFSEIQKEFGLKDKECLNTKKGSASLSTYTYHFVKMADGQLEVLYVMTDEESGLSTNRNYTFNDFKAKVDDNCF